MMPDQARTQELIDRHLDQLATDGELAELDRLVAEHADVAIALFEAARVDALLALHLRAADCGWGGSSTATPTLAAVADRVAVAGRRPWPSGMSARRVALAALTAAVLLLIAVTGWQALRPAGGHRVILGTVEVDGTAVTRLSEGALLRVVGPRDAVIELADGARAELAPASQAVIRGRDPEVRQVVELVEGGGRFHVPGAVGQLCVETASGSVTAMDTDFEVNHWSTQGKGDQEMSFRSMFVLAVAVLSGVVQVDVPGEQYLLSAGSQRLFGAEAESPKGKDLGAWLPPGEVLGLTGKGKPVSLERILPGVQGALQLTQEQNQKFLKAMQETVNSEPVRTAMTTAKLNPNATPQQKEEAKRLIAEARTKLQRLAADILTPEQKALIERINGVATEVQRQAADAMQADLLAAKGDEQKTKQLHEKLQQRVQEAFRSRMSGVLNAAQQAAYEKAAAAQAAAEKAGKGKRKADK